MRLSGKAGLPIHGRRDLKFPDKPRATHFHDVSNLMWRELKLSSKNMERCRWMEWEDFGSVVWEYELKTSPTLYLTSFPGSEQVIRCPRDQRVDWNKLSFTVRMWKWKMTDVSEALFHCPLFKMWYGFIKWECFLKYIIISIHNLVLMRVRVLTEFHVC